MRTYLVAFTVSLILSLIFTRLVRDAAHRYKLYDQPIGGRKIHKRPIPRLGGIAVAISAFIPVLALGMWENKISRLLVEDQPLLISLAGGTAIMLAVGIFDDLKGSHAIIKLAAQILAASLVYSAGIRVEAITVPFFEPLHFGWMSLPVTIFWMVLVMNAINLIDGLDGLAGGVVVLAGSTLFIMSVIEDDPVAAFLLVVIVGATLGFLAYNRNPASIFLGDTGSLLLGFLLALISVHSTQKSYTLFSIVAAILALGLPIFDLGLTVVRRFLSGQPIFRADQHHLHHLLLRKGLSQGQSVKLLIGAAVVLEGVALLFIYADDSISFLAILSLVPLGILAVHFLGYGDVIRNARRHRAMSRLDVQMTSRWDALKRYRVSLLKAEGSDEIWSEMTLLANEMELEWVSLISKDGTKMHWDRRGLNGSEDRIVHQDLLIVERNISVAGSQYGVLRMAVYPEKTLIPSLAELLLHSAADGLILALSGVEAPSDALAQTP